MNPDPAAMMARGRCAQLGANVLFNPRAIPPRTDCEERVADCEAFAVSRDSNVVGFTDPARNLLARRVAFIQVVVARTQDHARCLRQECQILAHHNNLRVKSTIDPMSNASPAMITTSKWGAAPSNQSNWGRGIMQVGNHETAHGHSNNRLQSSPARASVQTMAAAAIRDVAICEVDSPHLAPTLLKKTVVRKRIEL